MPANQTAAPPKTSAQRVAELRARRKALDLKQLNLYAHPDDCEAIKAYAIKLSAKRAKSAK